MLRDRLKPVLHGLGGVPAGAVANDAMVERVAFDGLAARLTNQPLDVLHGEHLGRGRAGVVVDELVPHRAGDVVGTVGQSGLRRADN